MPTLSSTNRYDRNGSKPAARPLPAHVPGVVITIQLDRYPEYLAVHRLQPDTARPGGLLLVKRVPAESE